MKAKTVWTKRLAVKISLMIALLSAVVSLPRSVLMKMMKYPINTDEDDAWKTLNDQDNHNVSGKHYDYVEHCTDAIPSMFVSVYNYCRFFLGYLVPLLTITVLYGLIAKHLKSPASQSLTGSDSKVYKARKRVVLMLLVMIIIFALGWLPLNIYFFLHALPNGIDIISMIHTKYERWMPLAAIFVYINCISNPILYTFMSVQYREAFGRLFTSCCPGSKAPTSAELLTGTSKTGSDVILTKENTKSTQATDDAYI